MRKNIYTNEETAALCESLAYMLHAGISNASALDVMSEDEIRPEFKEVLKSIARQANEGKPLSEILKESGCFEEYVYNLIEVGERTGRVEESLESIADTCSKRAALDRQIRASLVYPSILLLIMLAVITVLLIFVLPVFDDVYAQLGSGLTGLAGGFLAFGKILGKITPVLIAIFVIAVVFLTLFATVKSFRDKILDALWKRNGNKGVYAKITTARFAQGLAMGISSGLDIEEAIKVAAAMADKDKGPARAEKCIELLNTGSTLPDSLKGSGLLPATECRILEAGIRSGMEDRAMMAISTKLTEASESALSDSIMSIEPTMTVISSILVGLILVSVMIPLMNIMAALG